MLVFKDKELKEKVYKMFSELNFLSIDVSQDFYIKENYKDYENYDETNDVLIELDYELNIDLNEYDCLTTTLSFLLSIYDKMGETKLNMAQSITTSETEAYFLLEVVDYEAHFTLNELFHKDGDDNIDPNFEEFITEVTIDDVKYRISLFRGLCLYHILVAESGNFDEENPAYSSYDCFVRVVSDIKIDFNIAEELANSFIFELHSTLGLILNFSDGRCYMNSFDEDCTDINNEMKILPLLYGRGMGELIKLYNKSKDISEVDFRILGFTKVIEYISPTIAQLELYKCMRLKLSEPTIFTPTLDFINQIGEIYKDNRKSINSDKELIHLSIRTVVDLRDIWDKISFLMHKNKNKKYNDLTTKCKEEAIEILANTIYDTRNEIAHAKANYSPKGNECHNDNKEQFAFVLEKIAVRCIRWFGLQDENSRLTLS